MNPMVCLLSKDEVAQYWDKIEWRIVQTPSMERFYTKADIIDQICKDKIQVWTAGDNLVLMTQVETTPLGKIFQVIWAHGVGLAEHWEELKEKFHLFAWMQECVKIEVLGRPGWERKFRNEEGFKIQYVSYSCDVVKPTRH